MNCPIENVANKCFIRNNKYEEEMKLKNSRNRWVQVNFENKEYVIIYHGNI